MIVLLPFLGAEVDEDGGECWESDHVNSEEEDTKPLRRGTVVTVITHL
jgi:hypothetical protein